MHIRHSQEPRRCLLAYLSPELIFLDNNGFLAFPNSTLQGLEIGAL